MIPDLKCPRCAQPVKPGGECCPHCGFSQSVADDAFGAEPVLVERVTDAAGVLGKDGAARVTAALQAFERQFPQLFALVYCGAMPRQLSLRQFGSWLLNRAAVADVEASRPNENGAVLVIDSHGRSAALVLGYFLECYLDERDLTRILECGRRYFHRAEWSSAVAACLKEMTVRLRRRAAEAARQPQRFAPAQPPAEPVAPKLPRLRAGHRQGGKTSARPRKRR